MHRRFASCMLRFLKKKKKSANWRYTYIHDDHKDPLEAIDTHSVVVRRTSARTGLVYLICSSSPNNCRLLLLLLLSFLLKDDSIDILLWSLLLSAFIAKLFLWNPVEKVGEQSTASFPLTRF